MFAQQQLREAGYKITIDQWLIIKGILENPDISQLELGEKAFKDNASVTRIIDLLVKAAYLERQFHETDRRRVKLIVTQAGIDIVSNVQKVVLQNRKTALEGIDPTEIELVNKTMNKIIQNCHT